MRRNKRTDAEAAGVLEQLRKSPIRDLPTPEFAVIDLKLVDTDPTNPGCDETSSRYDRRAESISDSFDILGGPIYPLVVCRHPDQPGRYLTVDGHGRGDEARRRGHATVKALVYPTLTLEQRICLREVLNGAQEPFDSPLILKDLQLLARERKLDIHKESDLRALVADLPYNVRKHYPKLRVLAKWPAEVADRIGIDDDEGAGILGFDKVKELDTLVTAVKRNHPTVAGKYPGDALYHQALRLYSDGGFRNGQRSQEGIRHARRLLRKLPKDDPLADRFVAGELGLADLEIETSAQLQAPNETLVKLCKEVTPLLTDLDPSTLTASELRVLHRTADMLSKVLSELAVGSR